MPKPWGYVKGETSGWEGRGASPRAFRGGEPERSVRRPGHALPFPARSRSLRTGAWLSPSCRSRALASVVELHGCPPRAEPFQGRARGRAHPFFPGAPPLSHSCPPTEFTSMGPRPRRDCRPPRPAPHFAFNARALHLILFSGCSP